MATSRKPMLIFGGLAVALVTGGVVWVAWPEPPPEEPPEPVVDDTGLTRDETEDLMRTIGYVQ